jgi:hypothetical protein
MVVDEFDGGLCSVVGEKVVSAAESVLIADPVNLVLDPSGEVVGVPSSYQDVKVWIVGELNVYGRRVFC